jgi:hypothetical protein
MLIAEGVYCGGGGNYYELTMAGIGLDLRAKYWRERERLGRNDLSFVENIIKFCVGLFYKTR